MTVQAAEPPAHLKTATRACGVPDRTVICGESRSLTDTPCRASSAANHVSSPGPQSLQARSPESWARAGFAAHSPGPAPRGRTDTSEIERTRPTCDSAQQPPCEPAQDAPSATTPPLVVGSDVPGEAVSELGEAGVDDSLAIDICLLSTGMTLPNAAWGWRSSVGRRSLGTRSLPTDRAASGPARAPPAGLPRASDDIR
jgi:hypothetical protein